MGEINSVSLSTGETGPNAPDQATPQAKELGPHGVSIAADAVDEPDTPLSEIANPTRPDWLPEKFETAEDLAEAYSSLEARLGSQEAAPAPEAPEAPVTEEGQALGADALQPFYDEYAKTGDLTEESFGALEKMGLSRDLVSAFMAGQKATHEAELNKIYGAVGGQEAYQTALGWAAQAMSAEEITAFNEQVESGDMATAMVAVRGLMAMHAQAQGPTASQPNLLQTEPSTTAGAVYESIEQVMQDMKSAEYKSDPAFRARVQKKLSRSNVM